MVIDGRDGGGDDGWTIESRAGRVTVMAWSDIFVFSFALVC